MPAPQRIRRMRIDRRLTGLCVYRISPPLARGARRVRASLDGRHQRLVGTEVRQQVAFGIQPSGLIGGGGAAEAL